jgi:hypothetical protein
VRKDKARGKDNFFAVRFTMAHGKVFFKNWISYFFLFLHYKNIILYSIFQFYMCPDYFAIFNNYVSLKEFLSQFYMCPDYFAIFNNYVSLKEFLSYMSNLNCKCIK